MHPAVTPSVATKNTKPPNRFIAHFPLLASPFSESRVARSPIAQSPIAQSPIARVSFACEIANRQAVKASNGDDRAGLLKGIGGSITTIQRFRSAPFKAPSFIKPAPGCQNGGKKTAALERLLRHSKQRSGKEPAPSTNTAEHGCYEFDGSGRSYFMIQPTQDRGQDLPVPECKAIGFVDTEAQLNAITTLNEAGYPDTKIRVLHGRTGRSCSNV